ncbi:hypothetical protein ACA910_022358 [Epithemia clementina (nom. ined.)]
MWFLSERIHAKTLGNPLAVLQFLKLLEQEELLVYNVVDKRWSWPANLPEAFAAVMVTATTASSLSLLLSSGDKVLGLLVARIQCLPPPVVCLLKLALACTGYTFEESLLSSLYKVYCPACATTATQ